MSILVIGVGFLGSRVVAALYEQGVRPVAYDNLLCRSEYTDERASFVRGDVTDHAKLQDTLRSCSVDCIIWTAAIVGDVACQVNPAVTRAVNVDSLKWLAENYEGRLVFLSSCSVYGVNHGVATEKSPMIPQSLYAETKLQGEEILKGRENTLILRLGTLHGVSERMRFDLIVNTFVRRAIETGKITVWGGDLYRPFCCVDDVARLIANNRYNPEKVGTFNVASDNKTVQEIAELVQKRTHAAIVYKDFPPKDKRNYQVDSSLAQEVLGFAPKYTIRDSVGNIKRLLLSGRLRDTSEIQYDNTLIMRAKYGDERNRSSSID